MKPLPDRFKHTGYPQYDLNKKETKYLSLITTPLPSNIASPKPISYMKSPVK